MKKMQLTLNKRAKIKITPIFDFDNIKGYDIKLYYHMKNKYFKYYYWKEINSKEISSLTILDDDENFNKITNSLLNRNIEKKNILNNKIKNKLISNLRNKWSVKK